MTRTIISLEQEDKAWLDRKAQESGVPMAEIVRQAVRRMRQQEEAAFDKVLKETSGIWRAGEGLDYQQRLREEWR